jgi:hypothetical protein
MRPAGSSGPDSAALAANEAANSAALPVEESKRPWEKYGEWGEHAASAADTAGTYADFVGLMKEVATGEEATPVGSYVGLVTGTAEFAIGEATNNPYMKMSGAWTIGFAIAGLIVTGPFGFEFGLIGGSIPGMAENPGSFVLPPPQAAPGLQFINPGQ